ncbi:serine/threonine-protein kinase [Novipirellula artificiosorum]|uniref:non-specific serine/threonine protein kinase n=1 Tax=Novipirellula artificiosorum TaxID=2528016 RepID=A0A5C6DES2_9BACT|nr:serine/threonine-protein kinase [Novipirellula artificiosorum]TWU34327.1 Serine/threonine-protein kinase PrkC [Novipirellula artificiosorum]
MTHFDETIAGPPLPPSDPSPNACQTCGTKLAAKLVNGRCPECLLAPTWVEPKKSSSLDSDIAETMESKSAGSGVDEPTPLELGSKAKSFGNYILLEEIARGGMGVVYRARHQTLGREVALKLILSGQFASDSDIRRFQLEAESAAALDHLGIVPIYEIGEQDGHHFFTMKLIEGGSLADRMTEFQGDIRNFVDLLAKVASSIDYAHRRGILHRDIKPANILLDRQGAPVVTDLGLAKHMQADSDLTGTGAIVGTPAYMPPEQATASKEITTAADVYSLGAILYQALTGRPPHQAESAVATLMQAAKGDIQPPSERNRNVDRVLELICMKCLSRDPDDRYASAGAFAQDLRHWLAGESVSVRAKSFTSIFGDLVTNQLRSAIGAMLFGVLGGISLGLPIYTSFANRFFSNEGARFHIGRLRETLPGVDLRDPWWLYPPSQLFGPIALLGILFCLILGILIQRVVRPKDIRQAVAIGLVAGLLMTIVEFGMYGISANWQTFAVANAGQIETLADAGFAGPKERQEAVEELHQRYPDLRALPDDQKSQTIAQLISTQIMIASPPVAVSCLSGCLIFATVFCLFGTVHAHRLDHTDFHWANRLLRYLEVMLLLFAGGLFAAICVFAFNGMLDDGDHKVPLSLQLLGPLGLCILAVLPGWLHARWYLRWSGYALLYGIVLMA